MSDPHFDILNDLIVARNLAERKADTAYQDMFDHQIHSADGRDMMLLKSKYREALQTAVKANQAVVDHINNVTVKQAV